MATSFRDSSELEFKSRDVQGFPTDKDDIKSQAFQARAGAKTTTIPIETAIIDSAPAKQIHHTSMADIPFSSIPDPPTTEPSVSVKSTHILGDDEETEPLLQKQPSSSGGMSDIHTPVQEKFAVNLLPSSGQSLPSSTLKSRVPVKKEQKTEESGFSSALAHQKANLQSMQQKIAPTISQVQDKVMPTLSKVQQQVAPTLSKASTFISRNNLQIPLIAVGALLALWIGATLIGPHLWSHSSTLPRPVESIRPERSYDIEDHVIERKIRSGVVLEQLDTMPVPQPSLLESAQDELHSAKQRLEGIGASVQHGIAGVGQTIKSSASNLKAHLPGQKGVGTDPADLMNLDDHVIEHKSHGHVLENLDLPGVGIEPEIPSPSLKDRASDAAADLKQEVLRRVHDLPKPNVDRPTVQETRQAASDLKGSLLHTVRDTLANVQHKVGAAIPSLDTIKAKAAGLVGGGQVHADGGVHSDVLNPGDHVIEQKVNGGVVEKLDV